MRNSEARIRSNRNIARDTWQMVLQLPEEEWEAIEALRPGQFVNIRLQGLYLRRPISICDWDSAAGTITIIYKRVGRGTDQMTMMSEADALDLLWPLGNGYRPEEIGERPLLIGGGAGVPPMFGLCRQLIRAGKSPAVILGFQAASDVFWAEEFQQLGARTIVATEDGSMGVKGFVTDAMKALKEGGEDPDYDGFCACGPEPMLRAVCQTAPEGLPGWLSFEERMGCGFGACMGCSCETRYGSKRICKDGPVMERSEILW